MSEVATFTAPNGKQYQYDTWYPFSEPILVTFGKHTLSVLPTSDEAEQFRLQILLADGRVLWWPMFYRPEDKKHIDSKTHWRLPAAGFYEI